MFEGLGDFYRQFKALAWKNAILKFRYCGTLFLEIAVPTVIIVLIGILSKALPPSSYEYNVPTTFDQIPSFRYNDPQNVFGTSMCYRYANIVWNCEDPPKNNNDCTQDFSSAVAALNQSSCQLRKIGVAPSSSIDTAAATAAQDFVTWANNNTVFRSFDTYVYFSSENSFTNYITGSGYGVDPTLPIYSSAVIFSSAYPAWSYSLRMNQTSVTYNVDGNPMPETTFQAIDIQLKSSEQTNSFIGGISYAQSFVDIGYNALADVVNSYIATATCRSAGSCTDAEMVQINTLGDVDFPSAAVELNLFWNAVGFIFALLMILTLLYPIANVIRSLVQEKETKMKEGMMMMALRGDVHYLSWIFHFMCLFLPLAIILTIAGTPLFAYSEPIYIFFYFILFFMSATSYAFLVAILFNKALTAAIVGIVVFFMGFFIYIGIQTGAEQPTKSQILAACLHPATAFTYGTLAFAEYEGANIGITSNTWNVSSQYPITFQDTLTMMFVDTIWIAILSWYIGKIWPSEFGTHLPWYFVINPFYWWAAGKSCLGYTNYANNDNRIHTGVTDEERAKVPVETVTENLAAQIESRKCVDIRNLYKEFDTSAGKKVAVDGLDLTMYSGQITALLGHNGAGKSTTIAMLTGLITPDGGTAVIEGMDIATELTSIRRHLGVCPQHDVLFPDLTVEEHLILFASFKGSKGKAMRAEVEAMIQAVGLTEKKKAYSKTLSGGQKRKLSVGIAFIGGSRVVFLDEPTSGMDPYSRRFTWNIIKQHRENRVIVLTTHFMDEADLLGDRIAIMGDGRLKCCGSSLFLKNVYGVGYSMIIEKVDPVRFDSDKVTNLVTSYVTDAKVLTDAGAEISFQLPMTGSQNFQKLFDYIDEDSSHNNELGIESYGMSVTTLEEVFIKVAHGTETQLTAEKGRDVAAHLHHHHHDNDVSTGSGQHASVDNVQVDESKNAAAVTAKKSKKNSYFSNNSVFPYLFANKEEIDVDVEAGGQQSNGVATFRKIDDEDRVAFFFRHMQAMLFKRALYFSRDRKAWVFQYGLPLLVVLIGLIIMYSTSFIADQPSLTIETDLYNSKFKTDYLPTVYNNADQFCAFVSTYDPDTNFYSNSNCVKFNGQTGIINDIPEVSNFPQIPATTATTIQNMSQAIFDNDDNYGASQIGAFSIYNKTVVPEDNVVSSLSYFLHANYSAVWASPLYQFLMASSVVESYDSSASLFTAFNPLPLTNKQSKILGSRNTDLIVTFIALAIPWLGASYASYVVREREAKSKNQQLVSGVTVHAYWLANWIWDFFSYQFSLWGIVILVCIFPKTELLTSVSSGALGSFIGLLILFGTAMPGFSYLLSFLFNTPSGAQVIMVFIVFLVGFILGVVGIVLRLLSYDAFMNVVRYIFLLFPPYALIEGLHNLCLIESWSFSELQGGEMYSTSDMKITGANLVFLAWETVVYLAAAILYEYFRVLPNIAAMCCFSGGSSKAGYLPVDDTVRDEDVLSEEERVRSGAADESSTILVKDLKKMYSGGKYAVRGVSLGIPNGECFGLLGINGAGKSTTLAMLSGEFEPSSGEAFVAGLSLTQEVHKARRKIGFCPQFDALFDLLTGREHLELYARIQGVVEEDIQKVVNGKIAEMGLTEYASRAAYTYSGGNKRKLSVAIAMMGEPSIVFLDEPSTGMDPVARRFMWQVISDIVTKREKCSLILTTHSMEECEALCTRIGIMVGGVLRCLGSSQHLRTKYGHGYQIEIGMVLPLAAEIQAKANEIIAAIERSGGLVSGDKKKATNSHNSSAPSTPTVTAPAGNNATGTGNTMEVSEDGKDILITNQAQISAAFRALGRESWLERMNDGGSAAEIIASIPNLSVKHFASWWILEDAYDKICVFLKQEFGTYVIRERQLSKIRIEISAYEGEAPPVPSSPHKKTVTDENGNEVNSPQPSTADENKSGEPVHDEAHRRKLGKMFGAVESNKERLSIQDYSISQTSLEQIFNQFAAQQDEEKGHAAGIVN